MKQKVTFASKSERLPGLQVRTGRSCQIVLLNEENGRKIEVLKHFQLKPFSGFRCSASFINTEHSPLKNTFIKQINNLKGLGLIKLENHSNSRMNNGDHAPRIILLALN